MEVMIGNHPAAKDANHVRMVNADPRDTFTQTYVPHWEKDCTPEVMEQYELYQAWLKALKPGDTVKYRYYAQWGTGGTTVTTVSKITKTGMIRLADNALAEANGRVMGAGHGKYLQPYSEADRHHALRKALLYKLDVMKFNHFTDQGLALIAQAIQQAEDMLPKALEEGDNHHV